MNTQLQIFNNEQFGQVRVAGTSEQPLFCLSDIAKALGYINPAKAVIDHCKGVTVLETPTSGGMQPIKFGTENDVYRLIMRSKLPDAEKFQDWICEEVLPSIRKHGGYLTPDKVAEALLNPDTLIQLATSLKHEQEQRRLAESKADLLEQVTKEQAPKVLFANAVETSQKSCLVGELAKILNQNGVNIGQNRLFEWLRQNDYLCSKGEAYNHPTQKSMDLKLFEIKKTTINKPDGSILVSTTVKVTGKGQIYFVNKFLQSNVA